VVRRPGAVLNGLLHRRLPVPPEWLRRGPLRRKAFTSRLRSPWLTARLGLIVGIAFGTCFVTGLLSAAIQHPPAWFGWPSRPIGLYRVTQGVHVATGIASIPLLGAKLWSVYPKLFAWPPARDVVHALERLSVLVLSGAALFQLTTGVLNISYWYAPMPFAFIASHFWGAWLAIGALLVHIAVKLPIIAGALTRRTRPPPVPVGGFSRRSVLATVGAAVGVITLATVGQTIRPLTTVAVLAPRVPDIGPQGIPVNQSAHAAGVIAKTHDPGYRLVVTGPSGRLELSLADLAAMPQVTVNLPIACVEGWSAAANWTGVRVRDLLARVGAGGLPATVVSLQQNSAYGSSTLDASHAADPATLLALAVNGEPLHPDHGYPVRLIAPNRPGAMQTKWVGRLSAVAS
jgi:DMSO/TMAO reductase YedYZ molybdopterin-dependent catalytic subunit